MPFLIRSIRSAVVCLAGTLALITTFFFLGMIAFWLAATPVAAQNASRQGLTPTRPIRRCAISR